MMLTSKMILDIIEQIDLEDEISYVSDGLNANLNWPQRWRLLKERVKNLGVLR